MDFILGSPIILEESLTCEFKEIRGSDPVQMISKAVDEYVVAFLNADGGSIYWGVRDSDRVVVGTELNYAKRDLLRQVVGQKVASIAPPTEPDAIDLPFHQVLQPGTLAKPVENLYVVEVAVRRPRERNLYLTGSGEAYRKTLGGKKKLTGSELLGSLFDQLQKKQEEYPKGIQDDWGHLSSIAPSIVRRADLVAPLLDGVRILWVDDVPRRNLFERTAFSSLGFNVDIAINSDEAVFMLEHLSPDIIISDMHRQTNRRAGVDFLNRIREDGNRTPLVFYVGYLDPRKPKPLGCFGITNVPGELFHLVFDVLERYRT